MSKLILQGLLSLFVSLGVIVGTDADARGEVKQVWQETKATVQQAVEYVADTASEMTSQIDVNANVEAGAESNSGVSFGSASNDAQAGTEVDAQTDVAVSAGSDGGFFLDLGGDANTGLSFDLNFWK